MVLPEMVGLDWCACPKCTAIHSEVQRDAEGRVIWACTSGKQLGIVPVANASRLFCVAPMAKCGIPGARRAAHCLPASLSCPPVSPASPGQNR
jgi:hypothetical protein